MFSLTSRGDFKNLERFLQRMKDRKAFDVLDAAGRVGVDALSSSTPKDSGATAAAWGYEIEMKGDQYSVHWTNDNIINGFSVVIGLQYGHGTGTGGYVQGRDFINPAIRPIFDMIAETVWREVVNS